MKLLSRDQFRAAVFARDGHQCIFCEVQEGLDAHHVLERRLWPDGGYYLDNGATVCQTHHLLCERTEISVEEVRRAAGLKTVLPPHLYESVCYDKWGNIILDDETRLPGELFSDESVQKVLADRRHLFREHINLPDFFLVFSMWEGLKCLSWDDTTEWAALLGLQTVPVLYRGVWDEKLLRRLADSLDPERQEGFVVRPAGEFFLKDFSRSVLKWVRKNHVRTQAHWTRRILPNTWSQP